MSTLISDVATRLGALEAGERAGELLFVALFVADVVSRERVLDPLEHLSGDARVLRNGTNRSAPNPHFSDGSRRPATRAQTGRALGDYASSEGVEPDYTIRTLREITELPIFA